MPLAPHQELKSLLNEIVAICPINPRLFELVNRIETLGHAYMSPAQTVFEKCPTLSISELRVVQCLFANMGKTVTHAQLWNATYFDKEYEPSTDPISVRMTRIKRKIAHLPYEIECAFARGYRLVEKQTERAA